MGGVLDVQSVKKSFSVIVNKAKKILWVSATPWELDEKLMGARQGHTAYYGYKEAYDEGILNKTELVRVDCGLDITLTRNQENLSARELLKHEKDTLEIEGASADATFEQLNLEVRRALGRGLRTTDVPLLVQHRYQLMAQLYVAMHRDEKAIFWLPTKQHARMCAEYINRQMESETAAIAVTGDVRYDDDSQHKLADWRNPSGIIKVACVVYRLREGFDFPQLTYGFDCAWNAYNYRAAVQKIGRLVRRSARKSTSIYYYAVDAISIAAAHNREFANHFTGQLQKVYSDEDLTMTAAALADTAKLLQEVNFSSNHVVKAPTIESYAVGSEIVRATKIALFDVIDATGHLERDRIDLTDIFEGPKVQKADQIVADIEAGRLKMPSLSDSHGSTGDILRRVVSPYRSCYRPDLRERLIKCGALIPKESSISAAREKLERLVSEIERGDAKYGVKHPEYRWIWKYTNPKNTVFRPDIRERLIKCGALIPKIRTTSTES